MNTNDDKSGIHARKNIFFEFDKVLSVAANQIAFIVGSDNKILYCTKSASALLGASRKTLTNKKFPFSTRIKILKLNIGKKELVFSVSKVILKWNSGKYRLVFLNKIPRSHQAAVKPKTHKQTLLLQSGMEYKELFNAVTEAIYVQDKDGKFLDVNDGAVKMYGYPREFFIGKTPAFLSAPGYNDMQKILEHVEIAFSGIPQQFEFWGIRSNGEVFPKKVSLSLGKYLGKDVVIAVALDITESKKVDEALLNERRILRTVIDNLPDAVYAKDLEYKKILANKHDLKNMGCSSEHEVLNKTDFDFYSKEDASAFLEDDKKVIEQGLHITNREESFIDKDSQKHWLLTSKLPLFDSNGKISGLVGIGRDITEWKKADMLRHALFQISEAAYTASDMYSLYKKIHEVINNLMVVKNIYIALYDDKTELLSFPYWVDEFDPPLPPKKLGRGLTEYVLRTGQAVLVDLEKDAELRKYGEIELVGSQSPVWLGVPLKIGGKTIGVVVVQDYENEKTYGEKEMQVLIFVSEQIAQVIERKRSADAIRKYSDDLKQVNQTKDKFFSIIAHDLKNPFITILGFTDLLLADFYELEDEEKLFYIREMKMSADLSFNLLQNLLQWSRSQTGRIEFHPVDLSLMKIVNEIFLLLNNSAARKKIQLQSNVPPEILVAADEDMLNTVIRNLLTNAIKFSHKGGTVSIIASLQDDFAKVEVVDSGVGMNREILANLFRLDITHSQLGTDNESGTGIGLILCKEFIDKHGGKIWAESEESKGSKFIFTLPVNVKKNMIYG